MKVEVLNCTVRRANNEPWYDFKCNLTDFCIPDKKSKIKLMEEIKKLIESHDFSEM